MDLPVLIHRDLRSFVKDVSQLHQNRVYNVDTGYEASEGLFINMSKGVVANSMTVKMVMRVSCIAPGAVHIFCPVVSIEKKTLPYPEEGEIEAREKAWTDLAFRAEVGIRQFVDGYYNKQHDNAAPIRFSAAILYLDGTVWQSAIEIAGFVAESEL